MHRTIPPTQSRGVARGAVLARLVRDLELDVDVRAREHRLARALRDEHEGVDQPRYRSQTTPCWAFTEDQFQAQMEIMLSVFTDDCVMELVTAGKRWEGREQVFEFYRVFLSSLQETKWVPQALVIGPQGVLDVVNMTGTLTKEFAGLTDVGSQVNLQWVIFFPWVPEQGKFRGELVYSIRPL